MMLEEEIKLYRFAGISPEIPPSQRTRVNDEGCKPSPSPATALIQIMAC
jgi:hypothetical protein